MELKYVGPHKKVEIAETGQTVERNGVVEVTGDLAQNLLKQGWERVDKPNKKEDE